MEWANRITTAIVGLRLQFRSAVDRFWPGMAEFCRWSKIRVIASILFCVVAVSLLSCAHSPPAAPTLKEYGSPGRGRIQVIIGGDVKHPGRYWVSESSNLVTLEEVFGGWGGRGDFGGIAPLRVILIRVVDGREVRTKYSLSLPLVQKSAIMLKDGDRLVYPAVIF